MHHNSGKLGKEPPLIHPPIVYIYTNGVRIHLWIKDIEIADSDESKVTKGEESELAEFKVDADN